MHFIYLIIFVTLQVWPPVAANLLALRFTGRLCKRSHSEYPATFQSARSPVTWFYNWIFLFFKFHEHILLFKLMLIFHFWHKMDYKYRKVASSRLSRLVAHFHIFRLFMKENFDAYVLWPLDKMVQNWIVDRSTARDFTVYGNAKRTVVSSN